VRGGREGESATGTCRGCCWELVALELEILKYSNNQVGAPWNLLHSTSTHTV